MLLILFVLYSNDLDVEILECFEEYCFISSFIPKIKLDTELSLTIEKCNRADFSFNQVFTQYFYDMYRSDFCVNTFYVFKSYTD